MTGAVVVFVGLVVVVAGDCAGVCIGAAVCVGVVVGVGVGEAEGFVCVCRCSSLGVWLTTRGRVWPGGVDGSCARVAFVRSNTVGIKNKALFIVCSRASQVGPAFSLGNLP